MIEYFRYFNRRNRCRAMPVRLLFLFLFVLSIAWGQDKPKKPFQLYEEAEAFFNARKFAEALQLLDQCLKMNPGYMDAYSLRGSVKEQLNDPEGALTDYSIYLEK